MDAKLRMQRDAELKYPPTDFTLPFRQAVSGEGPRAYDWEDKPHRLIYDLCSYIEEAAARAVQPSPSKVCPTCLGLCNPLKEGSGYCLTCDGMGRVNV